MSKIETTIVENIDERGKRTDCSKTERFICGDVVAKPFTSPGCYSGVRFSVDGKYYDMVEDDALAMAWWIINTLCKNNGGK